MLLSRIRKEARRPVARAFQALLIGLFFLASYSRLLDFSGEQFPVPGSTLDAPKDFIERVTLHRSLKSFDAQTHEDVLGTGAAARLEIERATLFGPARNQPPYHSVVPRSLSIRSPPPGLA
jgi:hypothetical protein